MKKGIIKAIVLIVSFLSAVVGFGYFTNQNGVNLITETLPATYPVLSLYYDDYQVAQLHGYQNAMDVTSMHDSFLPLKEDRTLTMKINTYGRTIDEIGYELRNRTGERLIANRVIAGKKNENETNQLTITLENLLEQTQEYQLVFLVSSGDELIHYYATVLPNSNEHLDDYLAFVNFFHENSMSKDTADELSTYLEPKSTVNNQSLQMVTINSSLSQVAWADFDGSKLTEPVLTVAELNEQYAVLTLDYMMTSIGEGGESEYYSVQEYYRVSYNEEGKRCYLHNFERTMSQIFRSDGEIFSENAIKLGIRDDHVEYKKSENEQVICFVQEGELWSYNQSSGVLCRVFSFRGQEGMDARENYNKHDIQILSVDEGGGINFAVYGYMNRGIHEGQVGVSICHYDSVSATVEEELFLPSTKCYGRLKTDMGGLLYQNIDGILFYMMEGTIYRINMSTKAVSRLVTGLSSDSYCISEDNHTIVWQEDWKNKSDLTLYDMEREKTTILPANADRLSIVGFIGGDVIYGVASPSNPKNYDGTVPFHRLLIVDSQTGETVKEYGKDGYYISEVELNEYVITLHRVSYVNEQYVEAADDTIMNHVGEGILDENVFTDYDDKKQSQVYLAVGEITDQASKKILISKEVVIEQPSILTLQPENGWEGYYSYAKGREQVFHSELTDAIAWADEQMGVVIDRDLNAVWKRAKKLVQSPIDLPEEADTDIALLYPDAKEYDLSGAKLSHLLYYVSRGIPVRAETENGSFELIVGYDSANVWIYHPVTHLTIKSGMSETEEKYRKFGSKYTAYLQ
ncbi:MAG: hypothetical protein PUD20_09390 [bacterium]|nr:hypothetical protein [bacterium]